MNRRFGIDGGFFVVGVKRPPTVNPSFGDGADGVGNLLR